MMNTFELQIVDYEEANDVENMLHIENGVIFSLNIIQQDFVTEKYLNTTHVDDEVRIKLMSGYDSSRRDQDKVTFYSTRFVSGIRDCIQHFQ